MRKLSGKERKKLLGIAKRRKFSAYDIRRKFGSLRDLEVGVSTFGNFTTVIVVSPNGKTWVVPSKRNPNDRPDPIVAFNVAMSRLFDVPSVR